MMLPRPFRAHPHLYAPATPSARPVFPQPSDAQTTKRFNERIKRNSERFLADLVFALTAEEMTRLRSQFATSEKGRGGRRYRPYVFTEHGAIMAASALNTEWAVQVSVFVVRAFVQLRQMLAPVARQKGSRPLPPQAPIGRFLC